MAKRELITAARLRELLTYDPEIGVCRWRVKPAPHVEIGDIAGCIGGNGRRRIGIDSHEYLAARVAWALMTGAWPPGLIDHANLNKADDRWLNLREATKQQNAANTRLRADNTSGLKGVNWMKKKGKWRASIWVNGKAIHLGLFGTREEAHAAYCVSAKQHFGEFARAA